MALIEAVEKPGILSSDVAQWPSAYKQQANVWSLVKALRFFKPTQNLEAEDWRGWGGSPGSWPAELWSQQAHGGTCSAGTVPIVFWNTPEGGLPRAGFP